MAALLPAIPDDPAPLSLWQRITVELYVPACQARCDQHAVMIDGERVGLLSASDIGRLVRLRAMKRPSVELRADLRREVSANG